MNIKSENLSPEEYLALYRISRKKYIIGNFQDGITVHKQQIRALNIFNDLIKTGEIKLNDPSFRIAVFGAGMAGLTFTAAALKAGIRVSLIEKESRYLPLQIECDNRRLHPNIYDWPHPNSCAGYTQLPVLNWQSNTARIVSEQIIEHFNEIVADAENANHEPLFESILNCSKIEQIQMKNDGKIKIVLQLDDEKRTLMPNLIIYAVGFGIEKGVKEIPRTPSYWENDALNYIRDSTHGIESLVISGTGDGGFIDAFRCVIRGFSYQLMFQIFKCNPKSYAFLEKELLKIQDGAQKTDETTYFHEQFSNLKTDLKYINQEIERRELYNKIKVFVNGRMDEDSCLDHRKISLLNAFLGYLFIRFRKINYIKGTITHQSNNFKLGSKNLSETVNPLFWYWNRRGTDRVKIYDDLCLSHEEKKHVKENLQPDQKRVRDIGILKPRWEYSEFYKHFSPRETFQFLPDGTRKLFEELIHSIRLALNRVQKSDSFRITVHRMVHFDGKSFYQQVTPYEGPNNYIYKASTARIFDIDRGNIGLSAKTGRALLFVKNDPAEFRKVLERLSLGKDYEKLHPHKSFFSLPILAPNPTSINELSCNFVLYLDASSNTFFSKHVLEIINAHTTMFTEKINDIFNSYNASILAPLTFVPDKIDKDFKLDDFVNNSCWVDIQRHFPDQILLDKFYTFTIYD